MPGEVWTEIGVLWTLLSLGGRSLNYAYWRNNIGICGIEFPFLFQKVVDIAYDSLGVSYDFFSKGTSLLLTIVWQTDTPWLDTTYDYELPA